MEIAKIGITRKKKDEDVLSRIVVFLLIAKVTDLDLVYTGIERIIPGICDEIIGCGTWTYYTTYVAIYIAVTIYALLCTCKKTTTAEKLYVVFNAFLVCLFMACYILADNRLPLGCTASLMDNKLARDGLKVAPFALTSIVFIYSLFMYTVWYLCKEVVKK